METAWLDRITGRYWTPAKVPSYRSDKAEAFPRQRLNEALFFSAVSNRATGGIQAGRKRGVRYDTATPNGVDEIVLADDALPVSDQVFEQIEYLWHNGNALSPAQQFAPVGVEGVVLEEIVQGTFPQLPFGPL